VTAGARVDGVSSRAVRGSTWVVVGYGAAQVIRFGSNLILTRLLYPQAFGLMLLLSVFLQGLQMFSDLGIGTSVIQNRRTDAAFLNTAWTIQIARGLALWLVTVVAARPFALLYGDPLLGWMLPVAGFAALVDGLVATSMHTANRDLRMARLQVFEIVVQTVAALVMIACAWATRSVWALLAGMIGGSVTRTILSHLFLPGIRNRLMWEKEAARSLLHFGRWVFVSSVVTFLAQQGDRLVFGKMLPLERLGVYNIALSLCEAPSALISAIAFRVFFPLFAEMRRAGSDIDAAYRRVGSALALLGGAGALGLVVAGPYAVSLLYDQRYAEASWIIRLLALGIWGNSLVHFTASVVLASGRIKWLAAGNAARLIWLAAAVPLAFRLWGFEAAIAAAVLADVPRYVLLGLGCRREGLHPFRIDARRTAAFAAAASVGLAVLAAAGPGRGLPVAAACASCLALWGALNLDATRWYAGKARALFSSRRA